jgi:acetylglutamate kinase
MSSAAGVALPTVPGALQAQVLAGALPYLQRVNGTTFIVVCEGAVLSEATLRSGLGSDIALLQLVGARVVLLHAGTGLTLSALTHAHENLLSLVNHHGCHAVGVTPADGGPEGLAAGLIQRLHAKGFVPVVIPVVEARAREYVTTDSDALGCELASCLGAERLFFIADAPGVVDRHGRSIERLSQQDITRRRRDRTLSQHARARLDVASEAVARGVGSVHLVDGRRLHALLLEVLGTSTDGTTVVPDTAAAARGN